MPDFTQRFVGVSSCLFVVCGWLGVAGIRAAHAEDLRYALQPEQAFAYRVEISADRDDATEELKGVVTFKVKDVAGDKIRLGYFGGLTKTRRTHGGTSSGRRVPRGPRGGPPRGRGGPPRRGGPSIFSNPFAGLSQVSNELVVTPQGEVQSLQGNSQLPYLLGNLSILFFEPLPDRDESRWEVHNGVSITEGGGRRSRPPFRRPGPPGEQESRTAASESTTFAIERADAKQVVARKTYRLTMPGTGAEETSFEISGSGTWTFNRQLGVSESLDFSQKLVVQDGSVTVTVPVMIRYTRMSDEELANHEKQRKEMIADLKQKQQDRKKAGQQGLAADVKRQIIANLNSDQTRVITNQMVKLKIMKPHPDDKDIALLIRQHIDSSNRPLRVMSQAAWNRWKVLVDEPPAETTTAGENPFEPSGGGNALRTWTDATGKFTVEAKFVGLDGDALTLERKDGKQVTLPLSRLSPADREVAERLAK